MAAVEGLGIHPNLKDDRYNSSLHKDSSVQNALRQVFEEKYTPFVIPYLLAQQLHGLLMGVGYVGPKTLDSGGYVMDDTEEMLKLLKGFLPHLDDAGCQYTDALQKYCIISPENYCILDLNWVLIRQCFFEALIQQDYFLKQPECRHFLDYAAYHSLYPDNSDQRTHEEKFIAASFHNKNYSELFDIKNNFPDYWKTLLKNSLFIKKFPAFIPCICEELKNNAEALMTFIIEHHDLCCEGTIQKMLLQKNSNSDNILMLAARDHPSMAEKMLSFFTDNTEWFSKETIQKMFLQSNRNGWNILMLAAHYHPSMAEKMLSFFTDNTEWFSTETIQKMFLQSNKDGWNTLMDAARYNPSMAEKMLLFFTDNTEWFSKKTIQQMFLQKTSDGWNTLMDATHYHPSMAEKMLLFFTDNTEWFSKETIQKMFLQSNSNGWNTLMDAARNHPSTAEKMLSFFTDNTEWFSTETIQEMFLQSNSNGWNMLMLKEQTNHQMKKAIFNFLLLDFNRYSSSVTSSVTSKEKEIAKFLLSQLSLNQWEDQDLCNKISLNTASLLLSTFDKRFLPSTEVLTKIIPILLQFYLEELRARQEKGITYTTYFFGKPVGYPAEEKIVAAEALLAAQNKNDSAKNLLALKEEYSALSNGRLEKLFDACHQIAQSTTHAYTRGSLSYSHQ